MARRRNEAAAKAAYRSSYNRARVFGDRYGVKPIRLSGSAASMAIQLRRYRNDINNAKNRYQSQQRAEAARAQAEAEAQRQAAIKAEEERQAAAARQEWQNRFNTASEGAGQAAQDYFRGYDLDPAEYQSYIDKVLNETKSGYSVGQDFTGAFDSIGKRAFDNASNENRERAGFAVNQYFRPELGQSLIADDADDSVIADILQSQYTDAEEAAKRARNRNQMNETGYLAAIGNLGKQRETASSVLTGLGRDLLQAGRDNIDSIGAGAREDAGALNLGQSFDINPYQDRVQNSLSDFLGSLKGTLSSQAGNLFDSGKALSVGNVTMGAQNLGQEIKPKGIALGQQDDDDDPNLNRQAPTNNIF